MATPDNLFDSTRPFMTPELIHRVSDVLHEPADKVQDGFRTVIPTFLSGLIEKGTTMEGAEDLVHLVEEENFDTQIPANLTDSGYLTKGEHAMEDIFGENYHSVADTLSPSTGLSPDNVEKMMDMIAPVVMGVIGSKVKREGLSPDELKEYLEGQKKVLKGFTPKINRETLMSRSVQEAIEPLNTETDAARLRSSRKPPFMIVISAFIILLLAALYLISTRVLTVDRMTRDLTPIYRTPAETTASSLQTISDLPAFFLNSAQTAGRFSFTELYFDPGTTDLSTNGDAELSFLASQLKRNPKSTAVIEAFMEDTGDPDENLLQSENRAMLVREELIGRGVEPSRIRTSGEASKNTESGQVQVLIKK